MGAGGRGPSRHTEVVHASARTRVTRLFYQDRTVIRKEPLGPDAEQRLSHETAMLARLGGVAGLAQLAEVPWSSGSFMLADAGRRNLTEVVGPLAADDVIGLALRLARTIAGMHRREVIHRDITPANVVLSDDGDPCLVDFALATSFAEIRLEFTHHSEIAGTMAYLAPEQTGRTGQPVDQRADLYGLGATLYELTTGRPPFGAGPPAQLLHDHLTRTPVPPADAAPGVSVPLSDVIMHLLEKEPDNRYQSAEGLVYDLERLRVVGAEPRAPAPPVGAHDVPVRLLPPSRLVGRDAEAAELRDALADALDGGCGGVLISGAAGVGKTALVDELRSAVTSGDGRFVSGKFDQYRRDLEFDAANQAFRALGRLLLAEPEDELAEVRAKILRAVGPNAGLLTAVLPEFAALLPVPADPGDRLTAQARGQQAAATALRAIASRERPVLVFLDDLQWAGSAPLGFVDLLLSEQPTAGLLLVGAYRDVDVDEGDPLAALLSRWRAQSTLRHVRLGNLDRPRLVTMIAEMLHRDEADAAALAAAIEPHTRGNPYETVELLNALRRDGALAATPDGWRWQADTVTTRLNRAEAASGQETVQRARLAAMPERTRAAVEAMACLGGRAELSLLGIATDATEGVPDDLEPAIEDGLLVLEPGAREAARFRHDRLREAVLRGIEPERRRALQLAMARRLARVPELFAVAAEQYLPVTAAVTDPAERRTAAGLLSRAAERAELVGDYRLAERLLTAALALADPAEAALILDLRTRRHAALYGLARLDEADADYRVIDALTSTVLDRPDATAVRMLSLINQGRSAEANELGMVSLRECGIRVPAEDALAEEIDGQLDHMYWWLEHSDPAGDEARPDVTDPALVTAGTLLKTMLASTFFVGDPATYRWVTLLALRIWTEHGPARTLAAPATAASFSAIWRRGDYSAAYRVARRVLTLSMARGYVPSAANAHYVFSKLQPWFEPVENTVASCQSARDGLLAGGELALTVYTYHETVPSVLDCAPALDACRAEAEAALSFARRIGSEQPNQWLHYYQWLSDTLRGDGAGGRDAAQADIYERNPLTLTHLHLTHAVAAAILGDQAELDRHTAAALPLAPVTMGFAITAMVRPLRGLSLASAARAAEGAKRDALLAELDEIIRWLAARAADAPDNFLHVLRLVEAERAWTEGNFRAAVLAFDGARREVAARRRPWQRALITERAACFYLAHGLEQTGYELLAAARQEYLAWGATAKTRQLDWAYPALRLPADADKEDQDTSAPLGRQASTDGAIDLRGILSASQALSSETSLDRLRTRVTEVLAAMTGATGVRLFLWDEERLDWLPTWAGDDGRAVAADGGAPVSVLRYLRRTGEPLIVGDAVADERFARDPYFGDPNFGGTGCCSLLAVPITSHGVFHAALLLENRLIRFAFTAARLDAVGLIADQLAVSLSNAELYAEYRRVADEQAALRRVAVLVARATPPEAVFSAVAEETGRLLAADYSVLVRYDHPPGTMEVVGAWTRSGAETPTPVGGRLPLGGHNVTSLVHDTARPVRMDHDEVSGTIGQVATRVWGFRSSVGAPVSIEGQLWGALVVALTHEDLPLPAGTEERLAAFNELVATAIANAEASAEVAASRARIVAAADQARRRVERDLHDGAQQRLVSLALQLREAREAVPEGLTDLSGQLELAFTEAKSALDEVGEIARGLHPAVLSSSGLRPAVRALANRSPVPVHVERCPDHRLPEHLEVTAYFVIAEAITNATKHARASAVSVVAEIGDGALVVTVRDDGIGGADLSRGTGLVGLKDRVEALGGLIEIDSPRGSGTTLRAELPLVEQ